MVTNGYTLTDEDLKLIRKFDELKQRGFYCDSTLLTQVYNRVLGKHVNNTNCSSCMRARISELVDAANKIERMMVKEATETAVEPTKEETLAPVKEEENKPVRSKKKK